ncbi:MAG: hypothetical protein OFPI_20070 [Osedax symbiont Rs2]|nr:MAG: hypothetical protein OFPI_20070 [Osedax symbiont Rs2]
MLLSLYVKDDLSLSLYQNPRTNDNHYLLISCKALLFSNLSAVPKQIHI